jgi:repressor LexA
LLEISYDRLLSYENGKTEPPPEFFASILNIAPQIDIAWLLSGQLRQDQSSRGLPILSEVHAGTLITDVRDEDVLGYWPESKHIGVFGLKVRGDSMFPEIHEGDTVICNLEQPFKNGSIHVICTNDSSYTIKRVFERKNGFDLVPSNPEFATVTLPSMSVSRMIRVTHVCRTV